MDRTLLLNSTYEPITVIPWRKAMTLVVLDKVEALAHYDRNINTARRSLRLPAVVRLNRRVPWRRPRIRFNRRAVFARDNHTCQYCGARGTSRELTFDHVVPRSRGGQTNWTNIVTCCVPCNQIKGDRTPEEADMALRVKPFTPYWLPENNSERVAATSELWEPYLW